MKGARLISCLLIGIFSFTLSGSCAFKLFNRGPTIRGFWEVDYGKKLHEDDTKHDEYDMAEVRVQLKTKSYLEFLPLLEDWGVQASVKLEGLLDEYFDTTFELKVRELNLAFTPVDWMDVKIGRQILTWGTGDYLFVNDLFPKDYVSFYIGRDDDYLKKPSDAIRMSLFWNWLSLDLVWIPKFTPNTVPIGERLSCWDPYLQKIAGRESAFVILDRSRSVEDSEYAARLYWSWGSYEWAFYFFDGFYKNPTGFANQSEYQLYYPNLRVYGASVRGPAVGGVGSVEFGLYDSLEDRDGTKREVPNSKVVLLVGYEKDLGNDFRVGLQWQYEYMLDYDEYLDSLMPGDLARDSDKNLVTLRLTKQYLSQTLTLSLFLFWSPDTHEGYARPSISYDLTDNWNVTVGGNFIWGERDWDDFAQIRRNNNLYFRVRYSF